MGHFFGGFNFEKKIANKKWPLTDDTLLWCLIKVLKDDIFSNKQMLSYQVSPKVTVKHIDINSWLYIV